MRRNRSRRCIIHKTMEAGSILRLLESLFRDKPANFQTWTLRCNIIQEVKDTIIHRDWIIRCISSRIELRPRGIVNFFNVFFNRRFLNRANARIYVYLARMI